MRYYRLFLLSLLCLSGGNLAISSEIDLEGETNPLHVREYISQINKIESLGRFIRVENASNPNEKSKKTIEEKLQKIYLGKPDLLRNEFIHLAWETLASLKKDQSVEGNRSKNNETRENLLLTFCSMSRLMLATRTYPENVEISNKIILNRENIEDNLKILTNYLIGKLKEFSPKSMTTEKVYRYPRIYQSMLLLNLGSMETNKRTRHLKYAKSLAVLQELAPLSTKLKHVLSLIAYSNLPFDFSGMTKDQVSKICDGHLKALEETNNTTNTIRVADDGEKKIASPSSKRKSSAQLPHIKNERVKRVIENLLKEMIPETKKKNNQINNGKQEKKTKKRKYNSLDEKKNHKKMKIQSDLVQRQLELPTNVN